MTTAAPRSRPELPWSMRVHCADVPDAGRHFDLIADEAVRAAVAKLAGLRALPRFEAAFDVARFGRDGLHVVGHVSATVGQVCVVNLEPMESSVEEDVDLVFSSHGVADRDGKEVEVSPDDVPEPLIDGAVDLSVIATEFLILGIPPYPRKPDAVFESPPARGDVTHPFAALAALKKDEDQR